MIRVILTVPLVAVLISHLLLLSNGVAEKMDSQKTVFKFPDDLKDDLYIDTHDLGESFVPHRRTKRYAAATWYTIKGITKKIWTILKNIPLVDFLPIDNIKQLIQEKLWNAGNKVTEFFGYGEDSTAEAIEEPSRVSHHNWRKHEDYNINSPGNYADDPGEDLSEDINGEDATYSSDNPSIIENNVLKDITYSTDNSLLTNTVADDTAHFMNFPNTTEDTSTQNSIAYSVYNPLTTQNMVTEDVTYSKDDTSTIKYTVTTDITPYHIDNPRTTRNTVVRTSILNTTHALSSVDTRSPGYNITRRGTRPLGRSSSTVAATYPNTGMPSKTSVFSNFTRRFSNLNMYSASKGSSQKDNMQLTTSTDASTATDKRTFTAQFKPKALSLKAKSIDKTITKVSNSETNYASTRTVQPTTNATTKLTTKMEISSSTTKELTSSTPDVTSTLSVSSTYTSSDSSIDTFTKITNTITENQATHNVADDPTTIIKTTNNAISDTEELTSSTPSSTSSVSSTYTASTSSTTSTGTTNIVTEKNTTHSMADDPTTIIHKTNNSTTSTTEKVNLSTPNITSSASSIYVASVSSQTNYTKTTNTVVTETETTHSMTDDPTTTVKTITTDNTTSSFLQVGITNDVPFKNMSISHITSTTPTTNYGTMYESSIKSTMKIGNNCTCNSTSTKFSLTTDSEITSISPNPKKVTIHRIQPNVTTIIEVGETNVTTRTTSMSIASNPGKVLSHRTHPNMTTVIIGVAREVIGTSNVTEKFTEVTTEETSRSTALKTLGTLQTSRASQKNTIEAVKTVADKRLFENSTTTNFQSTEIENGTTTVNFMKMFERSRT